MNYLLIIPRALWKLFFAINFALGLIILFPLFYLFLLRPKWFNGAFMLFKFWGRWILNVPGIFVKATWKTSRKDLPHPAIYCANHASYLDIMISYILIPSYFVFMGKQELGKVPLFRIFFKRMNILVDRGNNTSSHRAFMRAAADVDKGHGVFLFPEGGISSSGKMRGFKNGAFKLAIEKQVPIVPITYLNNWRLLQNGGFFKAHGRPGISRVVVHPPVSTSGMTLDNLVTLKTTVHDIIMNELNNYNNENR